MKVYVSDLAANDKVASHFLLIDPPQVRKSKKGSDYWSFMLNDKTGEVEARLWDVPAGLDPGTFRKVIVEIKGSVAEWQDKLQISVSQIRCVNRNECDLSDFFEKSPFDIDEMWDELNAIVGAHCLGKAGEFAKLLLEKYSDEFRTSPAAVRVHHAYIGGLLEHVLSMCKTSIHVSYRYGLRTNLMVLACICHDIGKLQELSHDFGTSYTIPGTLVGHIVLGIDMCSRIMDEVEDFPEDLKIAVLHLIASHHGLLTYGSPKVPLMREAITFHLIDMLDAKLAICDRAFKSGISDEGMTEWVRELEGPLWRGPLEE